MDLSIFASGSSGNCIFVSSDTTNLLIDAGISMRRISASLKNRGFSFADINAILITHEHSDHISALGMISKYHEIPIFSTPGTAEYILRTQPVPPERIHTFEPCSDFCIGDICVSTFLTSHDAAQSVGYRLSDGCRSLSLATDLGFVSQGVFDAVCGSDTVILESNHDVDMLSHGRYPYYLKKRILSRNGHLSNSDCGYVAAALARTGTQHIVLAHLSKENNTPEIAHKTVSSFLQDESAGGGAPDLTVATPDDTGQTYHV